MLGCPAGRSGRLAILPHRMPNADLRDRLVAGASDVFYRDGIAATGIASLSKELRISKRTMYELFDSKDELVAAALTHQDELTREALLGSAERASDDPRERLLAVFTELEDKVREPGFRGCPFLNATAELAAVDHPAHAVSQNHKEHMRRWFERTLRRAGVTRARARSAQLLLVVDGALSQAVIAAPIRGSIVGAARAVLESP